MVTAKRTVCRSLARSDDEIYARQIKGKSVHDSWLLGHALASYISDVSITPANGHTRLISHVYELSSDYVDVQYGRATC